MYNKVISLSLYSIWTFLAVYSKRNMLYIFLHVCLFSLFFYCYRNNVTISGLVNPFVV